MVEGRLRKRFWSSIVTCDDGWSVEFRGSPKDSSFIYREGKVIKAEIWGEYSPYGWQIDRATLLPFGRSGEKPFAAAETQEIIDRITVACYFKCPGLPVEIVGLPPTS